MSLGARRTAARHGPSYAVGVGTGTAIYGMAVLGKLATTGRIACLVGLSAHGALKLLYV